jgi:solute carrier family 30 (zinc transporter), member 2
VATWRIGATSLHMRHATILLQFAGACGGKWVTWHAFRRLLKLNFMCSIAIMSDAAHMFSDVLSLVISASCMWLIAMPAHSNFTFGYHRAETIGAMISVLIVCIITGGLVMEALQRLTNPQPIDGKLMFLVSSMGIAFNLLLLCTLGHDHHVHLGGGACGHTHGHSHGSCGHDHGHSKKHGRAYGSSGRSSDRKCGNAHCNGHHHLTESCGHHKVAEMAMVEVSQDAPWGAEDVALKCSLGHHVSSPCSAEHGSHQNEHGSHHAHFEQTACKHDEDTLGEKRSLQQPVTHSHGQVLALGHSHRHEDDFKNQNLRGAIVHVMGDLLQSIGVAIAGAIIWCDTVKPLGDTCMQL